MINEIDKGKTDLLKKALDPEIDLSFNEKLIIINRLLSEIRNENSDAHANYIIYQYNLIKLGFFPSESSDHEQRN